MTKDEALKLALEHIEGNYTVSAEDAITAIKEALAQPEQEQIAAWLEKECDEQYLADRVRAGDYAKEKGHTENCAALADDIGKRHLSPSLVGVGDKDYTAQPEQEPVALQMDVIVVNLVREGINKHRARELAEHFIKHTTPPQRTWVGLEAEDRLCAKYMQDAPEGIEAVIDYIESKLKEKNT